MKNCTIYIPSLGRAGKFTSPTFTWSSIPDELRKTTKVIVTKSEEKVYKEAVGPKYAKNILALSEKVKGIAAVRAWIIENCPTRYMIMLDDDMKFFRRPDMKSPKLEDLNPAQMMKMFTEVLTQLQVEKVSQVGISARQGNNHGTKPIELNTRCMNVHAFDKKELKAAKVKLGRVKVMEDFDITLQLLRAGYNNAVFFKYAWNQKGSGEAGGCSGYRTAEVQAEAAKTLAKLHPGFVKVVEKESKSAWEGLKKRTDVIVSWKKAAKK